MKIIPERWIRKPDEAGSGFLAACAVGGEIELPMPIETHDVALGDVTPGKQQEFDFVFEGIGSIRVYANEEQYHREKKWGFDAEAYVPVGLMPPAEAKDFTEMPKAIIHGRVTYTYDDPAQFGFDPGDMIFTMTCLGYEIDAVIPGGAADVDGIEVGNIVSGIYWIQGWPRET